MREFADVLIPYRLAARETPAEARAALWLACAWDSIHFPFARRHLDLAIDGHRQIPAPAPLPGSALVPGTLTEEMVDFLDWLQGSFLRYLTSAAFPLAPGGKVFNRAGQDDSLAIPGVLERILANEPAAPQSLPPGYRPQTTHLDKRRHRYYLHPQP
jgi:hypothetical protein